MANNPIDDLRKMWRDSLNNNDMDDVMATYTKAGPALCIPPSKTFVTDLKEMRNALKTLHHDYDNLDFKYPEVDQHETSAVERGNVALNSSIRKSVMAGTYMFYMVRNDEGKWMYKWQIFYF